MPFLFDPSRKSRLDAPERDAWQMPDRVVKALDLRSGQSVVEIGSGTGYFTWRLSEAVGPSGHVFAVDLQQEMLDTLKERVETMGLGNVSLHKCDPVATHLDAGVADHVFLANLTHEYEDLVAGLSECARITRPGGSMAVVDWVNRETETGPPLAHRLAPETITRDAEAAGWSLATTHDFLPNHSFLVYRKAT